MDKHDDQRVRGVVNLSMLDISGAWRQGAEPLRNRFKLVGLSNLGELESGVYWPRLQPFFLNPSFRQLTYRLTGAIPRDVAGGDVLSTRGASGAGELDVAYIADRCAAKLLITESGLPDYCLTFVIRGTLTCSGSGSPGQHEIGKSLGLIYRGRPGTAVNAASGHERIAIWIPAASLRQRLTAMLGGPMHEDVSFDPVFVLNTPGGQKVLSLVRLMMGELDPVRSFSGNGLACRSFTDLLLYAMLEGLPNSYSKQLTHLPGSPIPGTVRRAEDYIRNHAQQPITLTDLAAAAGCSVRNLQLGFRQFRDITPAVAILLARLQALRQGIDRGEATGTVTDVAHQYGFTNPGRLTALYKTAFGVSPAEILRIQRPDASRRR